MKKLIITPEFEKAIRLFEQGYNLQIFGSAGVGKSVLIDLLRNSAMDSGRNCAVVAPTGIAARNVDGVTINSFFGFPPYLETEEDLRVSLSDMNKEIARTLSQADVVIIDESSMMNALTMDNIIKKLQFAKVNNRVAGGVQIVIVADPFQLSPTVTPQDRHILLNVCQYKSIYFFDAEHYAQLEMKTIILNTVFRQKDAQFVACLNKVRRCESGIEEVNYLNECVAVKHKKDLVLTTTNAIVDAYNIKSLDAIKEKHTIYQAVVAGQFKEADFPTTFTLALKRGCPVMIVANLYDADDNAIAVNGDMGRVYQLSDEEISVELNNGEIIEITPYCWQKYAYQVYRNKWQVRTVGYCTQFPIKVCAATTIHKAQGLSLDSAYLDLSGRLFAPGQLYTALSRVRTKQGLRLSRALDLNDFNRFKNTQDTKTLNAWYSQFN